MTESDHALREAVYLPDSPLRRPARLLGEMLRDLRSSRELAWRLMVRNLRAQYRQSLLGFAWAVIPPIVTAVVFSLAKGAQVVNLGETELPYAAYVMLSMTLWQTFAEALGGPLQVWIQSRPMLIRIYMPREALIVAKLGEVAVGFGIKMVLIIGIFVWYEMPVTPWALLAPFALIPLILLGIGLGTLLASVGGLYQDVSKGLPFLTLVWLMLTPVVYPAPAEGAFAQLVRLNPVTPLLVTVRELSTTGQVSDPAGFWIASCAALVSVVVSWMVLRISAPFVIERMSS